MRIRSKDFEYDAKRVITKRKQEVMIPVNDSIEEMQKVTFDFEKGQTLHKAINSSNRDNNNFYGEFDSGSGLTLAACLTHASRTIHLL